jgi:hypothetical protein
MDLTPLSVAIGNGDGLVARIGDLVMFVADPSGAGPLLRAIEPASAAASPGRAAAKALAAVALGPDSGLVSAFGVVAPTDGGLMLILRGAVAAHVEADGAIRTLSGDRALTWVDETVAEPVDTISVGAANSASVIARPHTDLRAGVVPGGGFVLRRTAAAQVAPPPTPPAVQRGGEETRAVQVRQPRRAPAPRQASAPDGLAAPPAARPRPPQERAATPPAGPTATPRPVIGVLADGDATYPLDRSYVIGRNPLSDASVRDSSASPIVLADDPQISRIHAYLTVAAGAVMVRDAGTAAGTFIAAPGDAAWIRVGDRPTELKPGGCVRIGQRILLYRNGNPTQ